MLHLNIPRKRFFKQTPMIRVCYALLPLLMASIYFFGWRAFALTLLVCLCGLVTEALFTFRQGKPVSSAVLVTCLIFSLSLPPTLPYWMAVVGIVTAVAFGKMVFGGSGRNVFNPAMVGRCFIYISFPVAMNNRWVEPVDGGFRGLAAWMPAADAMTGATALIRLKEGGDIPPLDHLIIGNMAGSLGETSALLVLLGGAYLLYKKIAPWRLAASCLTGALITVFIFRAGGVGAAASPAALLLSGSFLFGTLFVVTDPVSGAKTPAGQWIYGLAIGSLTMILRFYSNFPEGMMFAVLLMNAFVPLLDLSVRGLQRKRKTG